MFITGVLPLLSVLFTTEDELLILGPEAVAVVSNESTFPAATSVAILDIEAEAKYPPAPLPLEVAIVPDFIT